MSHAPVRCVGVSSLFLDGLEGTESERHVVFCDLDSKRPIHEPGGFRTLVRRVMDQFDVGTFYAFETLKGVHLVSFSLYPRRLTERIEERFRSWGSDDTHQNMSYRNGQAIMRVTPKPGEGQGPRYVAHFTRPTERPYSSPHFAFFRSKHGIPAPSGVPVGSVDGDVRLEAYDTYAVRMT
ncbi:MAG TPA: hypothetical protein VI997_02210 [Candidatus Thermoplasmatota archaeon]|nr:hypothetical protein [Candidatus Thermoplasmatota archaeon]